MNFTFHRLQHIGIPVTNLATSETFYQKLGFTNVMQAQFPFKGDRGNVAMMQKADIIIELYQMPKSELDSIRNRKDGHIDHIAFDVDDVTAAFSELKKNGFKVIEEAPVFLPFWRNGCKYFNIVGPDGERLEFNQIL